MNKTQPFAMVISFIHPHDPYVARPEWWDLYNKDDIDLPLTAATSDPHTQRLMKGIQADTVAVTDDEIRNARHAYYANTSYFDSKVGEIVKALREAGQLDNTIVVVTSDHGDMLGERGLWYKMNFFEHSARVPLIIAGPDIKQQVIPEPVSLVDLLPTFLDIAAQPQTKPALGMPIDGHTLWPSLTGAQKTTHDVFCEYCAECASHPMFMIRKGDYKYIHCDVDPPQLFNVNEDPFETINLATNPAFESILNEFAEQTAQRWDSEAIRDNVLTNQKQRRAVHAAMEAGALTSWDYQPVRDASQEFVRNHMDWTVAAEKTRFPPFKRD